MANYDPFPVTFNGNDAVTTNTDATINTQLQLQITCGARNDYTYVDIDNVNLGSPNNPALTACPVDRRNYTAADGRSWKIQCNIDYPGADLGAVNSANMSTCMDYCALVPGCVAITFVPGQYSNCFPKSSTPNPTIEDYECDSAVVTSSFGKRQDGLASDEATSNIITSETTTSDTTASDDTTSDTTTSDSNTSDDNTSDDTSDDTTSDDDASVDDSDAEFTTTVADDNAADYFVAGTLTEGEGPGGDYDADADTQSLSDSLVAVAAAALDAADSESFDPDDLPENIAATTDESGYTSLSSSTTTVYLNLMDASGSFQLSAGSDGNLYVDGINSGDPTGFFAGIDGIYGADMQDRLMYYYGAEMSILGVSRFRLAEVGALPHTAKLLSLVPISVEGSSIFVAADTEANQYWLAGCNYKNGGATKIFLIADPDTGLKTLESEHVEWTVTGGFVSSCGMIALKSQAGEYAVEAN